MSNQSLPRMAGLILGISMMIAGPAGADALKDEIAPTGKLRVAIAISPAGGAFSCEMEVQGVNLARLRHNLVAALRLPAPYSETLPAKDQRASTAWQYTPQSAVWLSGGLPDKPAMNITLVRKLY